MNITTIAAEDHPGPVLTPPPNPAHPQKPTEADREEALAWISGGSTAAHMADIAARAARRAAAAAELEAGGWTEATAYAAITAAITQGTPALRTGPRLRLVNLGAAS